jgi:hypothetical protein
MEIVWKPQSFVAQGEVLIPLSDRNKQTIAPHLQSQVRKWTLHPSHQNDLIMAPLIF